MMACVKKIKRTNLNLTERAQDVQICLDFIVMFSYFYKRRKNKPLSSRRKKQMHEFKATKSKPFII